jgi:hypothetical protein
MKNRQMAGAWDKWRDLIEEKHLLASKLEK